jgi:hypothetical protein
MLQREQEQTKEPALAIWKYCIAGIPQGIVQE